MELPCTRICAALITTGSMLFAPSTDAQIYPDKPVRIIVPFAAGGPADVYARVLGQKLQETLGQAFVIDDRPGGGAGTGSAGHQTPVRGHRAPRERRLRSSSSSANHTSGLR